MHWLVPYILVAMVGVGSFGSGCLFAQTQPREILHNPRVAIADRLMPGDTEVLIYKEPSVPDVLYPRRRLTYEQEIDSMRFADIIALVRVSKIRGELIEQGTWIRTVVSAEISQLVQSNASKQFADSIEFTFSGGNTRIGHVDVTAGSFPRFVQGEQYLVFLVSRPRISLGTVLHVNANGVLEHIKSNTGAEQSFQTHLIGRTISEVLKALAPIK